MVAAAFLRKTDASGVGVFSFVVSPLAAPG
jgi:hypothetical protein